MNMVEKHQSGLNRATLAHALAGPVLLFLLTTLFYWKLTTTDQYTWLDSPDLANQVLPWWNFEAREWHAGRFPAWDPHQWGGQPLVGQMQPGAAYPLNWLLFLTPLRNGHLRLSYLHWFFILFHWIAALNAYRFCLYLGRFRPAAILGGCIFAFGAAVGNIDWPQMANGAIWMPLVFLNLCKIHDEPERANRHAAWAGLWLGLSWLAGHHQIPTFVTYAALATWLWLALRQGLHLLRPFLLFVSVMGLISALQTVPAAEYGPLAKRWVGMTEAADWKTKVSYHVHELYSLFPISLLGTVFPGLSRSFPPFVGAAGLTLALLGLFGGWRQDARVRWLSGLGLLSLLVALGPNSLLHGVLYAWAPLVEKARSPGMAMAVFGFAVAALASAGLARMSSQERLLPAARRMLLGVAALVFVTYFVTGMVRGKESFSDERPMITALVALLLAGLFTWHRTGELAARHLAAGVIGLSLLELANVSGYELPNANRPGGGRFLAATGDHDDIAAYLKSLSEPVRVEVDSQKIGYNFGDWHGISHFGGYLASLTTNLVRLDPNSAVGREIFSVTHYVGSAPRNAEEQLVFPGKSGVNVYRLAGWHPRVWTVHTVLPVDARDLDAAMGRMIPQQVRQAVTIVGPAPSVPFPGPNCAEDRVRIRQEVPSHLVIAAQMGCAGVLILGDTHYPGWQVTVDGKAADLIVAYGVARAVVVPAGEHTVEFAYRPVSLRLGAAMSLLGLLLVAAVTYGTRARATAGQE
ncbi:MAG: YfhO family protein [Bryobacteraceae bacterium]|nr:YfhO family protein [Bryobacteraceae bacterium]